MKTAHQPAALFDSRPYNFSQVVTAPAGRLVYVAGQTAWDEKGELIGGNDLAAQTRQALANIGHALDAAGASVADITMMRHFVVDYEPELLEVLVPEFRRFFQGAEPPANTLLGVQALALPEFLIEIEAQAVVNG